MPEGFQVRSLTVNLEGQKAGAQLCLHQSLVCIGNTLRVTPLCCLRWLSPQACPARTICLGWWSQGPGHPGPGGGCGAFSPIVDCMSGSACQVGSQVAQPGSQIDPATDIATLKAELRQALAQIEEIEKAQSAAMAPKTQGEITAALEDLDLAQKQIDAARTELQGKLKK